MGTISSVRVRNFGSISDSDWVDIEESFTTLIGPNGAGKSNFLQAITEFGKRVKVIEDDLCALNSAQTRQPCSVPIVSLRFSDLSMREAPVVQEPLTPADLNLPISELSIDTTDGNSEGSDATDSDLSISANLTAQELTITKYADGSHRVHLTNGRRVPVSTVIDRRINEVRAIGEAVLEQLNELHIDPHELEPDASVIDRLTEIDTEELVRAEEMGGADSVLDGDESTGEEPIRQVSISDIVDDIEAVSELLSELTSAGQGPLERLPALFQSTKVEEIAEPIELSAISRSDAYQGLLNAADIAPDRLDRISDDIRIEKLEKVDTLLTDLLNGYFTLDSEEASRRSTVAAPSVAGEYTVSTQFEPPKLKVQIGDGSGETFLAHRHSTGVRWILGFLLTVIHGVGNNGKPGLVVLDDPGVHLHPKAQKQLLEALRKLTNRKQVIYCTHSPFLIDNDRINHTRIIKHTGTAGTAIQSHSEAKNYEDDMDSLAPIRDSLGATLGTLPFGSNRNVIVEGYSDRQYLTTINSYLAALDGWSSIDADEIAFVDATGSRIPYMAQFLETEGLPYLIVLDDDADDIAESVRTRGPPGKKIYRLSDFLDDPVSFDRDIENLLSRELLCEAVATFQPANVSAADLLESIDDTEGDAWKQLKDELHRLNGTGHIDEFSMDKEDIADEICYQLEGLTRDQTEQYPEMLDRFSAVLHGLETELSGS